MAQNQWPSAGRVVHVEQHYDGRVFCRAATIVHVVGEGETALVELFIYPSSRLPDLDPPEDNVWDPGEWHWPEYVGPAAAK